MLPSEVPLESDDEDAETEDDEPSSSHMPGPESTVMPEKQKFEVDCDVDIKSPWLLDLLSDVPTVTEATAGPSSPHPRKDNSSIDLEELFANW
jgi:hypothetical protein